MITLATNPAAVDTKKQFHIMGPILLGPSQNFKCFFHEWYYVIAPCNVACLLPLHPGMWTSTLWRLSFTHVSVSTVGGATSWVSGKLAGSVATIVPWGCNTWQDSRTQWKVLQPVRPGDMKTFKVYRTLKVMGI